MLSIRAMLSIRTTDRMKLKCFKIQSLLKYFLILCKQQISGSVIGFWYTLPSLPL